MTNLKYAALQNFISSKILDKIVGKYATSIAVGVVISRLMPVPGTVCTSGAQAYVDVCALAANTMASSFNENILIDLDVALETARTHWLVRYYNMYPEINSAINPVGKCGFLSKLCSFGFYLNPQTQAFCEANSELMIVLINRIHEAIKE